MVFEGTYYHVAVDAATNSTQAFASDVEGKVYKGATTNGMLCCACTPTHETAQVCDYRSLSF